MIYSQSRMPNYGFAIDLGKCIGCHACSIACKVEHEIPVGVNRCWVKTVEKGTFPDTPPVLLSRSLQPMRRGALREDLPDQRAVQAPRRHRRSARRLMHRLPGVHGGVPLRSLFIDPNTRTAEKCNFCANRVENDLLPACVSVCPTECRIFGELDDPTSEVALIAKRDATSRRKPEKGTIPKVFYIGADDSVLSRRSPHAPSRTKKDRCCCARSDRRRRIPRGRASRASITTRHTRSRGASTWPCTC